MSLPAPPPLGGDPLEHPTGAPLPDDDPILGAYQAHPEPSDAPGVGIGPDEVSAFLVGVGDVLAQLRGDHWRIEAGETALLAPAISRQLNQPGSALAEWIAAHTDAFLIILGAGVIVVPRAVVEYQVIRWRREQLRLAAEQQQPGGVPIYEYPGAPAAEPYPDGADAGSPVRDAGGDLSGAGAQERTLGVPTDPERLAAATATLGRR